jgi:branched-chain amino acid transport system permease protein
MSTVTADSDSGASRGGGGGAAALGGLKAAIGRLVTNRLFQPGVVVAVLLITLVAVPAFFKAYWIGNFMQLAVFAPVVASAGLLYGRVGLVSLGQVAPYGIGTWVTIRLAFATHLPYPVLVIIAGLVAMILGVLIGLPALRVSGLYLALVTLMLAAGVEIVLTTTKFANGGPGFKGLVKSLSQIKAMRRPSWATTDVGYYRFSVIATFVLLALAAAVLSRKPGRAWASIRQSEAAALSAGIDVTRYKILAFALASFMAGAGGGLFAGTIPKNMTFVAFNRQAAIFLIAVTIMGGVTSIWGGVLGAFFATCLLKFLTQNVIGHKFWDRFSLSLFGFGLLMNLIQGTKAMQKKGQL